MLDTNRLPAPRYNTKVSRSINRADLRQQLAFIKSDLAKGVVQRKFPFNPHKDVQREDKNALHAWQQYETPESSDAGSPGPMHEARHREHMLHVRQGLSTIHPHARIRALNRLSGLTRTRLDPATKKREFLLHRAMSMPEYQASHDPKGSTVSHQVRTSWTPDEEWADKHAREQTQQSKRASAWIHEDNIVHMPKMYGALEDLETGLNPMGSNKFVEENEVIVKPHTSQKARASEVKGTGLHERINRNKFEHQVHGTGYVSQRELKARLLPAHAKKLGKSDQPQWKPNSDQDIANEYNWEYKNHWHDTNWFPTLKHFSNAVKQADIHQITPEMDQKIGNRSRTQSVEELKHLTAQYKFPRDVDRIVTGLKEGHPIPHPIIIKQHGRHTIMSGNTRMDAAFLQGINPHVAIIDLDKHKVQAPPEPEKFTQQAQSKIVKSIQDDSELSNLHKSVEGLVKAPLSENQMSWAETWKEGGKGRDELHETMMHPKHAPDRKKMLSGLAQDTQTKQIDGVRHFLLHRGHDTDDEPHYESEPLSYSADKKVAEAFAMLRQNKGRQSTVTSEWIPERHISYAFDHSHRVRNKGSLHPMFTGKSLGPEKEVIVGPTHEAYQAGHVYSAFTGYDGKSKPFGKSKENNMKKSETLNKPYVSEAQRRKFHAMENRGEISHATVHEWDEASKGKKLPEKVKKAAEVEKTHVGFKALSEKIQHREGYTKEQADATAAAIGRAKYGKEGMAAKAKAGKVEKAMQPGMSIKDWKNLNDR